MGQTAKIGHFLFSQRLNLPSTPQTRRRFTRTAIRTLTREGSRLFSSFHLLHPKTLCADEGGTCSGPMFQVEPEPKRSRSLFAELLGVGPCPTALRNWRFVYFMYFFPSRFFIPFTEEPPPMNPGGIGPHSNLVLYRLAGELFPGFIVLTPHLLAWHLLLGRLTPG